VDLGNKYFFFSPDEIPEEQEPSLRSAIWRVPGEKGEDPEVFMHGVPEYYLIGKNDNLRKITA
jgi:hypothetical protein